MDDLNHILTKVYKALKLTNKFIRDGITYKPFKNFPSIKGVAWIAELIRNPKENKSEIKNVVIENPNIGLDFIGIDIDIGFRIAQFSTMEKIVINDKLAYILFKMRDYENADNAIISKLRIVLLEKLKEVWDGMRYPIIIYDEEWSDFPDNYRYFEKYQKDFINQIIDNGVIKKDNCLEYIINIIEDQDLISDYETLFKKLDESRETEPISKTNLS